MARGLMNKYGLNDWGLRWSADLSPIGYTSFEDKAIYISSYWITLNPARRMKHIVLHEIAHVLAGADSMHGKKWIEKCKELKTGHQETIAIKGTGWNAPYEI